MRHEKKAPYNSCGHDLVGPKIGYVNWHAWAEEMGRKGERQEQCPRCGLWLFECERPQTPDRRAAERSLEILV